MEELQAQRLLVLVDSTRGQYLIPDGRTLVNLFSSAKKKMTVRGARAVIQRLERHGCIRRENGKRYIDEKRVVTQMSSCIYLLSFREHCLASGRTTTRAAFHQYLVKKYRAKFSETEKTLYAYAVKAEYIREVETAPEKLEMGSTLEEHLPYLELFRKRSKS